MRRWIVASCEAELARLNKALDSRPAGAMARVPYWLGQIRYESVAVGIVGVGIVSAALAIGGLLASGEVGQMIMVGSAGAFPGSDLEVGDVAVASSETLSELGICAGPGVGDAGALGLLGVEQTIVLDQGLSLDMMHAAEGLARARKGPFLSVAGVSDGEEQALLRAGRFQPLVENMEGYALALAGKRWGIPVVEIRGVSNHVGCRDKSSWNLDQANNRVQEVALAFCQEHAFGARQCV